MRSGARQRRSGGEGGRVSGCWVVVLCGGAAQADSLCCPS
jgi:hypothetical protein